MATVRASPELRRLRAEIADLDRAMVRLLGRRLRRARRAVRVRLREGADPTDPEQEVEVRSRARRWARAAGLSERFVDRLMRGLMELAKVPAVPPSRRVPPSTTDGARRRDRRSRIGSTRGPAGSHRRAVGKAARDRSAVTFRDPRDGPGCRTIRSRPSRDGPGPRSTPRRRRGTPRP